METHTNKQSKLRICVLHITYEDSKSEFKDIDTNVCTPANYFTEGAESCPYTFTSVFVKKATSFSQLQALVRSNQYDCFFNLCDGEKQGDTAGEDVIRALEELNVPYTGINNPIHYEPSKPEMKMVAFYNKIKTPKHFVETTVPSIEDLKKKCEKLRFPLITKDPYGVGSAGMTRESKCRTVEDLHNQIKIFLEKYHSCLIEEFITGDEVSVLSVETPSGTRVLHPIILKFPFGDDFKHFNMKWEDYNKIDCSPLPEDDPALTEILRVGKVAFESILGGVGYGRSDLRICRETNEVYFLEINPMCGIFNPPGDEGCADYILKYEKSYKHQQFIADQIQVAMKRHALKQPYHELKFDPDKGYQMVAKRFIPKGTIVFNDEGQSFPLVSKPYVLANWNAEDINRFTQFARPLCSDGHVYITLKNDLKRWRPLKHSSDPNLILAAPHSLNWVAARDIEINEELTMDYSTFCDGTLKEFDCVCRTPNCRGTIKVSQEVLTMYGKNAWHRECPKN